MRSSKSGCRIKELSHQFQVEVKVYKDRIRELENQVDSLEQKIKSSGMPIAQLKVGKHYAK